MPVNMMLASMPEEEYLNWQVFLQYEPYNTQKIQLAVLSTIVSSALGGKSKFEDFMMSSKYDQNKVKKEQKPMSGKALEHVLKGMFGS